MLPKAFLVFYTIGSLLSFQSFGQQSSCDTVYIIVEEMPEFGKSNADLMKYVTENLTIRKDCRIDQRRTLAWTIDKEGNMIDCDVLDVEAKCKDDIIQKLKEFPRWKPGKLKGKPVCVRMTMVTYIKFG